MNDTEVLYKKYKDFLLWAVKCLKSIYRKG